MTMDKSLKKGKAPCVKYENEGCGHRRVNNDNEG
jgi:hypothetical protein